MAHNNSAPPFINEEAFEKMFNGTKVQAAIAALPHNQSTVMGAMLKSLSKMQHMAHTAVHLEDREADCDDINIASILPMTALVVAIICSASSSHKVLQGLELLRSAVKDLEALYEATLLRQAQP